MKLAMTKFGSAITSYVRYGSGAAAHWCVQAGHSCPNPNVAVYGPGYAGELDVVGHEFMHGVIAHEAQAALDPGAVNIESDLPGFDLDLAFELYSQLLVPVATLGRPSAATTI